MIFPFDYPAKGCSATRAPGQVCGPCLQLQAIDTKLYALQEEVNKLLLIRTEVKERLNQHHDPFTRHLPMEITSNIFAIYTEIFNSDFDLNYATTTYGGPLLLGAVSKSWREIAFATPHLWNTVNVVIPSIDKLPITVELTKQWLDRSRQLPLYLSLVHRAFEWDEQTEGEVVSLIPLFNILQNVAPRWYKLVLGIPPTLYTTFLGELTCAPALNTLFVRGLFGGGQFFLPLTPSLKHLDVQSTLLLPDISIDWGNLTTLKYDWFSLDELFEVLRLARVLESFTVHGLTENTGGYPIPIIPLTHSTLKRLYLGSGDDAEIDPFQVETLLGLAVFPSLEQFGYGFASGSSFPIRAIQSLFNRSHCQLTHFDLSGDLEDITSDELISILSDLPTITHLKLEDRYSRPLEDTFMSDELLQSLTPIHHGEFTHTGRLLPRLESLEFLGYKTFSWTCLASLVSTPSDVGPNPATISGKYSSIRRISFRVYFRGEMEFIDAHSAARFKGARDAGIEIVILNETPPHRSPAVAALNAAGNRVNPVNLLP